MDRDIKKELIQCMRNNDFTSLPQLFEVVKTLPKVDVKMLHMLINMCSFDPKLCQNVFDFMKEKCPQKIEESGYTAVIKSFCQCENYQKGFEILEDMIRNKKIKPHIRTFLPFFGGKITFEFYNNVLNYIVNPQPYLTECEPLLPTCELFSSMIQSVSHFQNFDYTPLVRWISTFYETLDENLAKSFASSSLIEKSCATTISDKGICQSCHNQLKLCDITKEETEAMLQVLKQNFKNKGTIIRFLQGKQYDVVIDGANVAMYNNSPFNLQKLEKISKYFSDRGKKVLIILHIVRKRKRNTSLEKFDGVDVFYSHKDENDDLFWLYAALSMKALLVTDDQMCDHLFKMFSKIGSHVYLKWVRANVVNFHFAQNVSPDRWLELTFPQKYSDRLQVDKGSGYAHIPFNNADNKKVLWMCCKIK